MDKDPDTALYLNSDPYPGSQIYAYSVKVEFTFLLCQKHNLGRDKSISERLGSSFLFKNLFWC